MQRRQLELRPIDSGNWEDVGRVRPKPEQQAFIAPDWYSLLETTYKPNLTAVAAASEAQETVGFAMFGFDEDDHQPWIYRLMVDAARLFERFGFEQRGEVIGGEIVVRLGAG